MIASGNLLLNTAFEPAQGTVHQGHAVESRGPIHAVKAPLRYEGEARGDVLLMLGEKA